MKILDPTEHLSSEQRDRLKRVRMLILDVDGILTDGRVFFVEGTGWTRFFDIKDGLGLRLLMKNKIDVAWISAGQSKSVSERAAYLGVQKLFLGSEDKLAAYEKIKTDTGLTDAQVAYMGDDLPDLPVFTVVGFAATVPSAMEVVRQHAHYLTKREGGRGAVREVADLILHLAVEKT